MDVFRQAMSLVQARLPAAWGMDLTERFLSRTHGPDAVVRLRAPDGTTATFVVEVKRLASPRDVAAALQQLWAVPRDAQLASARPMLIARYLSPSSRAQLEQAGAAYADATGNLRIALDNPALFLRDTGADSDPWRGPGRPRGSLRGPVAARVVRALVDFAPPVTVPQLIRRSGASVGATYRVVEFLSEEALIERKLGGPIEAVAWRRTLERWAEDYGFQRSNSIGTYLQPRGIPNLLSTLRSAGDLKYTLTGSLAAAHFAPYAPARLAMLYVDDIPSAARRLDLRPVETGANVLLAAGSYEVVFDRSLDIDGLVIAAPTQVAVDLLMGPGRSASEAEALLDWMEAHEHDWRR